MEVPNTGGSEDMDGGNCEKEDEVDSGAGKRDRRGGRGSRRGHGKEGAEGPSPQKRTHSTASELSGNLTMNTARTKEIYEMPPISPSLIASRGIPNVSVDQE